MRKLSPFESFPIHGNIWCQLAMKFHNKKDAHDVAHVLNEKIMGTRVCSDGVNIIPLMKHTELVKIPQFTDINYAVNYVTKFHIPKCSEALGKIAYNDKIVVVNTNHTVGDGTYLIDLNKFVLGESKLSDNHLQTPIALEEAFKEEMAPLSGEPDFMSTPFNYEKTRFAVPESVFAPHLPFEIPLEKLKCYNNGKLNRITDNLWTSLIMSASAKNNYIDMFGLYVCYNLRKHMKKPTTFDHCNIFARKAVSVPINDKDEFLTSVNDRFRQKFDEQKALDDLFRFVKQSKFKHPPNSALNLEISNVGTVKATGIIEDIYLGLKIPLSYSGTELCLLTYTIDYGKRKVLMGSVRSPIHVIPLADGQLIAGSVQHFLENIDLHTKVNDAMQQLYKFQQNYVK